MRYLLIIILIVITSACFFENAWSATIKIERDLTSLQVGDVFSIDIVIDSEGQILNAVEAELVFPAEFLDYTGSNDGNSVISLWIAKPTLKDQNRIILSGITPGGFIDANNQLVSLNFKVINEGQGKITVENANLLVHDGLGTEAIVKNQNLHLSISKGEAGTFYNAVDDELPESFTPGIIEDPDLFEGAHTLVFTTKDKGSGVDYFEVREGVLSNYTRAESLYRLNHQALDRKIYVKAVDKMGNERIEIFYPQNWRPWHEHTWVIVSILILCILSLLIFWKILRKRLKK